MATIPYTTSHHIVYMCTSKQASKQGSKQTNSTLTLMNQQVKAQQILAHPIIITQQMVMSATRMLCPRHLLFFCLLVAAGTFGMGSADRPIYDFGDYGVYFGGYNVSPQGAGLVEGTQHGVTSHGWFPTATKLNVNAASLLKAFDHPDFSKVAVHGSLHNHVVFIAQVLSVILAHPSSDNNIQRLIRKFALFLSDANRPLLFVNAFSLGRMQKIINFFNSLDVRDRREAQALYDALMAKTATTPYEEAVIELTFLLFHTRYYLSEKNKDDKFLPGMLQFYFENFVLGTGRSGQVKPKLAPGAPLLLAKMIMKSCEQRLLPDKLYFGEFLGRKADDEAYRPDLRQAIAFEIDGLANREGRVCLNGVLEEEYPVDYNRRTAFPRFSPTGKLWLKHSPLLGDGWSTRASVNSLLLKPKKGPAMSGINQEMQLNINLEKSGILNVDAQSGNFLLVRVRQDRRGSSLAEDDSSLTDSLISGKTDDDGDDGDSDGDSYDESFATDSTEDTQDNKVMQENGASLAFRSDFCLPKHPCKISVEAGDIVLVILSKRRRELSAEEQGAIQRAWESENLENTLLQIAATLPESSVYHVSLITNK